MASRSISLIRPEWREPLTHYQYDTFKTNPTLDWVEPAYVTFSIDANGKVDQVTMKPVSPDRGFQLGLSGLYVYASEDRLTSPSRRFAFMGEREVKRSSAFFLAIAGLLATSAAPAPASYSVLIRGGTIYDGSGDAP